MQTRYILINPIKSIYQTCFIPASKYVLENLFNFFFRVINVQVQHREACFNPQSTNAHTYRYLFLNKYFSYLKVLLS